MTFSVKFAIYLLGMVVVFIRSYHWLFLLGLIFFPIHGFALNPMDLKACSQRLLSGDPDLSFYQLLHGYPNSGLEEFVVDYHTLTIPPGTDLKGLFYRLYNTNLYAEAPGIHNVVSNAAVATFLNVAKNQHIDLQHAQVLIFTKNGDFNQTISVHQGRVQRNWQWHFHVVVFLSDERKVIDFGYSNFPKILSLDEYIGKMFGDITGIQVNYLAAQTYLDRSYDHDMFQIASVFQIARESSQSASLQDFAKH